MEFRRYYSIVYQSLCVTFNKENSMDEVFLTTDELAERIKYDVRTIRERLKDSVLLEGVHYFRPFGGRKILYRWDAIQRDMRSTHVRKSNSMAAIPMANGGVLHA